MRTNISVGIQYLEAWLNGDGAPSAINNLMEDAATAEIARAQVWQWLHHGAKLEDGRPVTMELVKPDHGRRAGQAADRRGWPHVRSRACDLRAGRDRRRVRRLPHLARLRLDCVKAGCRGWLPVAMLS